MKKVSFLLLVLLTVLTLTSCKTVNLETNRVGWSNYSDLVVKDYDVVGIVTVESTETITNGPLMLTSSVTGSRVTYNDLMKKAQTLNADDIINVRIDVKQDYTKTVIDFFTGSKVTYTYIGTAAAIRYKDANADVSVGANRTVSVDISPEENLLEKFNIFK